MWTSLQGHAHVNQLVIYIHMKRHQQQVFCTDRQQRWLQVRCEARCLTLADYPDSAMLPEGFTSSSGLVHRAAWPAEGSKRGCTFDETDAAAAAAGPLCRRRRRCAGPAAEPLLGFQAHSL